MMGSSQHLYFQNNDHGRGDRYHAPHRCDTDAFAKLYPLLVNKAEKKGRTRAEVDQVTAWLTGYTPEDIARLEQSDTTYGAFFQKAPAMNPDRTLITGKVCGVRVEEIQDPLMRDIRYLDKLVDELAKGKSMEQILRK